MLFSFEILACLIVSVIGAVQKPLPLFYGAEVPDYNIAVINDMLESIPKVRRPGEGYALYDWDNTCMFGDISETSVYYQVQDLNFRVVPEEFEEVYSLGYKDANGDKCFPQGINTVVGKTTKGQPLALQTLLQEASRNYARLFHAYIGPHFQLKSTTKPPRFDKVSIGGYRPLQPGMSLVDIRQTKEYNDFAATFGKLIFTLEGEGGADEFLPCAVKLGMTTLPQLLVGMTESEIKSFIHASIRYNLNAAISKVTFTSTIGIQGELPTGVRIFNGQEALMRTFQARNVSVYVISASPQQFVDVAADFFSLTYSVPKDNIFGVRFRLQNGKFTGQLVGGDYPVTWGPGKAQVTKNIVSRRHNGRAPLWVSGDSQGDCAFLSLVEDGIAHVNNRLADSSSCIQKFYDKSCQYYNKKEPKTNNRYLMQGQDKEIGSWINSGYSTKDGVTYSSGTKVTCNAYKVI